jgi:VWFA-related protein
VNCRKIAPAKWLVHRETSFAMQLVLASVTVLPFAALMTAWGQGTVRPTRAMPSETPLVEPQRPIRTRVGEVSTPVAVRDRRTGEMIVDLAAKDFHVFDNGVEQTIDHFDLGNEPLSIVLAVETSSHIEPMLNAIRRAGIVFTSTVMGKTGEAAVLGYDDTVRLIEPFTADSDQVQHTISHLPVGSSGICLYDAMTLGISLLKVRPVAQRRVLMIIGEAEDSGSGDKLGGVLKLAERTNVTIYSVGLSSTAADLRQPAGQYQPPQFGPTGTYPVPPAKMKPPTPEMEQAVQPNIDLGAVLVWLVKTGKNAIGYNPLELASDLTGGLLVNAVRDRTIEKAIDEIGGELHAGYTIVCRPPDNQTTGYHTIKVTLDRSGVSVRARPGYYIEPPEQ